MLCRTATGHRIYRFLLSTPSTRPSIITTRTRPTMDLTFDGRCLHLPLELVSHICSFLENASDACAVRLTNRLFCAAATPLITDVWDSPSLLFTKPNPTTASQTYAGSDIDPQNRPRWVEKPITIWTWLSIPSDVTLEDGKTAVGERLAGFLNAPDKSRSDYSQRSFRKYGRKAVCWGRMQERPELFCIIMRKLQHYNSPPQTPNNTVRMGLSTFMDLVPDQRRSGSFASVLG